MGSVINAATNVATGGRVGYSDGKFGKGEAIKLGDKATGGALSKFGNGLKDTFLGKKDPGTPDEVIDLGDPTGRAFQNQAIGKFGGMIEQDFGQMAENQSVNLENQARAGANDQEIRARQMVAQRGLGGTSLGLSAILNQKAGLSDQIGAIRANKPMLENQMTRENLQLASGGINQILNEQGQSKVLKMGQASKGRQGGLMPLIGAGVGAYLGGPAGAQAGMSIGQATTQLG